MALIIKGEEKDWRKGEKGRGYDEVAKEQSDLQNKRPKIKLRLVSL